jgi:hypothetical protein
MHELKNVRTEVYSTTLNSYHIRVIALVAAITIFDGYDNFIPSYVIHFTQKAWGLSLGEAGFLVSSGLIGFMIGALFNFGNASISGLMTEGAGSRGLISPG